MIFKGWKLSLALLPVAVIGADFGLPWGAQYIVNAPGFYTSTALFDGSQRDTSAGIISNATKTAGGVMLAGNGSLNPRTEYVITNEFTVGVWLKTATNANMTLFGSAIPGQSAIELTVGDAGAGTATNAYLSLADTNRPGNADNPRIATPNPRDGRARLLVATADATSVRIYLDGIQKTSVTRSVNSSGFINLTNAPTWGALYVEGGTYARRYSGELRIGGCWYRALTSNEITRWYLDGIGLEANR